MGCCKKWPFPVSFGFLMADTPRRKQDSIWGDWYSCGTPQLLWYAGHQQGERTQNPFLPHSIVVITLLLLRTWQIVQLDSGIKMCAFVCVLCVGTVSDLWPREAGCHVCTQWAAVGLQHGDHLSDGGGNSRSWWLLGWQQRQKKASRDHFNCMICSGAPVYTL